MVMVSALPPPPKLEIGLEKDCLVYRCDKYDSTHPIRTITSIEHTLTGHSYKVTKDNVRLAKSSRFKN